MTFEIERQFKKAATAASLFFASYLPLSIALHYQQPWFRYTAIVFAVSAALHFVVRLGVLYYEVKYR